MFSPYISWILIFFVIPTAVLWLFFWRHLLKYWTVFLFVIVCSTMAGLTWDAYAVKTGIWHWPAACCNLARLPGGIPQEEIYWAIAAATYICTVTIISRDIFKMHRKLKKSTS